MLLQAVQMCYSSLPSHNIYPSQPENELHFLYFRIFFLYSLSVCHVRISPLLSAVPQGGLQCATLSAFLSKSVSFHWMRGKH